jgi:hypothetical protein
VRPNRHSVAQETPTEGPKPVKKPRLRSEPVCALSDRFARLGLRSLSAQLRRLKTRPRSTPEGGTRPADCSPGCWKAFADHDSGAGAAIRNRDRRDERPMSETPRGGICADHYDGREGRPGYFADRSISGSPAQNWAMSIRSRWRRGGRERGAPLVLCSFGRVALATWACRVAPRRSWRGALAAWRR